MYHFHSWRFSRAGWTGTGLGRLGQGQTFLEQRAGPDKLLRSLPTLLSHGLPFNLIISELHLPASLMIPVACAELEEWSFLGCNKLLYNNLFHVEDPSGLNVHPCLAIALCH